MLFTDRLTHLLYVKVISVLLQNIDYLIIMN